MEDNTAKSSLNTLNIDLC